MKVDGGERKWTQGGEWCEFVSLWQGNRKTLSLEMLGLMYRLNERDIEWQGVIEPE